MSAPPSSRRAPIILCADDYGLAPGIGIAIRDLAAAGRLSAVSCMSITRCWPGEAELLRPFADRVNVGLHLTLTDHAPLGPMPCLASAGRLPSVGKIILRAILRRIDTGEVAAEFERQLERFEGAFGGPPRFIDGHQHVHLLPGIGPAVFDLFRRRLAPETWVRYCDEPLDLIWRRAVSPLKASVISLLGREFARRGRALGVPGNSGFRGVHDFRGRIPYERLLAQFLAPPHDGALVMVHPGLVDAELVAVDPLTYPREVEYAVLASDAIPALLAACGVKLVRGPGDDRKRSV